jgi:hypothetical protein
MIQKQIAQERSEEFHKEAMKKYTRGVTLPSKEDLQVITRNVLYSCKEPQRSQTS